MSRPMERNEDRERDPKSYDVIGAGMEVHRVLGNGFLEAVYQEALAVELGKRKIPFEREVALPVRYKDVTLSCGYRADFICYGEIIVELKALDRLTTVEQAQVINYLKATGMSKALLLNFGARSLESKRMINTGQSVKICGICGSNVIPGISRIPGER